MENLHISETELWSYISKTADGDVIQKVELWKSSSKFDKELFDKIELIYNSTKNSIGGGQDIKKAKNQFFNIVNANQPKIYNWKNTYKYVAILAIIISGIYTYQFTTGTNQIIVQTNFGENKQINLSDGSVIWLNSSSKLSYDSKHPRTLYLEGEGFFEVAKDPEHPFTVTTFDNIEVKALGTSFNVKSYLGSNSFETVLLTGKVEVIKDKQFKNKILMSPNEKLTFLKNDKNFIKQKLEHSDDVIAWKKGKIQFKNKSFKEIAKDLAIQFNINIKFENQSIANSKFTGSFEKTTPVHEILETLKVSKDFSYEQNNDKIWTIK